MRLGLVHGFTQTAASWDGVVDRLPDSFDIVRVELPGHGREGATRRDFVTAASAIGAIGGDALYVGYSMGGRLALQLALDRPKLVRGLVLVGASPGIAAERERAARRGADELLATELEDDGVDAFLVRWLAQPLFATLPADAAGVADRTTNSAAGLARALRTLGTGAQPSAWDRLGELKMPVLLVAGALDTKFTAIADEMTELIGNNAHTTLIPGAGHAAQLEQPAVFARMLTQFASDVADGER